MKKTDTLEFEVRILPLEKLAVLEDFVLRARGKVVEADAWTLKDTLFPLEELKVKYKSIEGMPLNINHVENQVVGCLVDSQLVYPEKGNPEMWVDCLIWEFLHPEIGEAVRSNKNKLTFSVEVYPEVVVCPECHKELDYLAWKTGIDLCEHWKKSDKRIFKNFLFLGCALLLPPVKPAVPDAKAEVFSFDFSLITLDNLKKMSDEELLKLHEELHREFRKKFAHQKY